MLTVWGAHNTLEQSLADNFHESLQDLGGQVTYQVLKGDWFAFSGYRQGKIFYQKTCLVQEVYKTFTLEYPAAQRSLYDPITAVIARSFPGN